jgi:hypothetical protein
MERLSLKNVKNSLSRNEMKTINGGKRIPPDECERRWNTYYFRYRDEGASYELASAIANSAEAGCRG